MLQSSQPNLVSCLFYYLLRIVLLKSVSKGSSINVPYHWRGSVHRSLKPDWVSSSEKMPPTICLLTHANAYPYAMPEPCVLRLPSHLNAAWLLHGFYHTWLPLTSFHLFLPSRYILHPIAHLHAPSKTLNQRTCCEDMRWNETQQVQILTMLCERRTSATHLSTYVSEL